MLRYVGVALSAARKSQKTPNLMIEKNQKWALTLAKVHCEETGSSPEGSAVSNRPGTPAIGSSQTSPNHSNFQSENLKNRFNRAILTSQKALLKRSKTGFQLTHTRSRAVGSRDRDEQRAPLGAHVYTGSDANFAFRFSS